MGVLKAGTYKICSPIGNFYAGVDIKQHHDERSGHLKEGTPIKVMREESAAIVEVQELGGNNYRLTFIESPSMNLGCDERNLRKNNKVFATRERVEWTIEQGNQEEAYRIQVHDSRMLWTIPPDSKPKTQITLEKLNNNNREGQEWCFEDINERN